jgi:pimeloyl-ACP methyl ester carboxylesterase
MGGVLVFALIGATAVNASVSGRPTPQSPELQSIVIFMPGIDLHLFDTSFDPSGVDGFSYADDRVRETFPQIIPRVHQRGFGFRYFAYNHRPTGSTPDPCEISPGVTIPCGVVGGAPRDENGDVRVSYYPRDTQRHLAESARDLEAQIKAWGTKGKRYDIIAHSLGGAIAAYWATREASDETRSAVRSITTLSSPVSGFLDNCALSCDPAAVGARVIALGGAAGQDLIDADVVSTMRQAPLHVDIFTFGNGVDQVVPGYAAILPEGCRIRFSPCTQDIGGIPPLPPFFNHLDILKDDWSLVGIDAILDGQEPFPRWADRHSDLGEPSGATVSASEGEEGVTCAPLTGGELINVNGITYVYVGGQLHEVPDQKALQARGWDSLPIREEDQVCIQEVAFGAPVPSPRFPPPGNAACPVPAPNDLWKASTAAVYLYMDGELHRIPDPQTFVALGLRWDAIRTVPDGCIVSVGKPLEHLDPPEGIVITVPDVDPPDAVSPTGSGSPPAGESAPPPVGQSSSSQVASNSGKAKEKPFRVDEKEAIDRGRVKPKEREKEKPSSASTAATAPSSSASSTTKPTASSGQTANSSNACLTLNFDANAPGGTRGPGGLSERAYLVPPGTTVTIAATADRQLSSAVSIRMLGGLILKCDGTTVCRGTLPPSDVGGTVLMYQSMTGFSQPPSCGNVRGNGGVIVEWRRR